MTLKSFDGDPPQGGFAVERKRKMNFDMNLIDSYMVEYFNSPIAKACVCVEDEDDESRYLIIFVQLENGIMKMVNYQYDIDYPFCYGVNVEEFDPFVYEKFFNLRVDKL